jgi:hypothetical protein
MSKKSYRVIARRKKNYKIYVQDIARVYCVSIKKRPKLPNYVSLPETLTETE